jgi:hypothetical protein
MISVTSVTKKYILQPLLIKKHKKTLYWLSSVTLWKSELNFFQKALEEHAPRFTKLADKKKIDHFQNLLIYYSGEVIDSLRSKLRGHESRIASILKSRDEVHTQYFLEHDALMDELETFAKSYRELKENFVKFIARKK